MLVGFGTWAGTGAGVMLSPIGHLRFRPGRGGAKSGRRDLRGAGDERWIDVHDAIRGS
jgi:hypothetical protein